MAAAHMISSQAMAILRELPSSCDLPNATRSSLQEHLEELREHELAEEVSPACWRRTTRGDDVEQRSEFMRKVPLRKTMR